MKIIFKVKGKVISVFNKNNLLYMESVNYHHKLKTPPIKKITDKKTGIKDVQYEGETSFGIDITFKNSNHVYGLPERSTSLSLNPTRGKGVTSEPYRLYNLDIFRYDLNNPIGLYGTVPILWSLNSETCSAVFSLNPSETFVDIEKNKNKNEVSSFWISETGVLDFSFIPGPTPKNVFHQYSLLTGNPALPQKFAFGHHQSKWNYKDEEDVMNVDSNFDKHNIPYDVIWLDIEHTDDKKYFTYDLHHFPDPLRMQKNIGKKGRKIVTITDPHIKRSNGYFVHEESKRNNYYVKNSDGKTDFEGDCWPGKSSWLDFFKKEVRNYWANLYTFEKYKLSSPNVYTWIDMNEPSVFSGPETTSNKDVKHLCYIDKKGKPYNCIQHREVHNQYGFYQGMATYQGHLLRSNGNDRPFILSRSFFAGSQRYVWIWTGDNIAKWEHLEKSTPMVLNLGLGGIHFTGSDVGGFFDDPEEELLVRWYQVGAFHPFFRAHAEFHSKRREPWVYVKDKKNFNKIRRAIIRRYKLLPYFYTTAFESFTKGLPIARPLWVEYMKDKKTYEIDNQFLLGKDLMIKSVFKKDEKKTNVHIPGGDCRNTVWYDIENGNPLYCSIFKSSITMNSEDNIPVLQRGGSILPLKMKLRRSSKQMKNDHYSLQIGLNLKGEAEGSLYFDDGKSFDYQNKGNYLLRKFKISKNKQNNYVIQNMKENISQSIPNLLKENQEYQNSIKNEIERIIIFGFPKEPKNINLDLENSQMSENISPNEYNGGIDDIKIMKNYNFEFDFDKSKKILTIRKPELKISKKWKIIISF